MYIFAVHCPVYLGNLWPLAYPGLLALTLLCILVTCGHLLTLCFDFNSPVYFGYLWPLAYPVL